MFLTALPCYRPLTIEELAVVLVFETWAAAWLFLWMTAILCADQDLDDQCDSS